jgi:para-nitrobenzyl esterase
MTLRGRKVTMMVAAIMFSIMAAAQAQVTGDPVNVDGGQISGKWRANASVRAYLGIPFAAPPVGDLRWKPPQPVTAWDGVRPAHAYAPRCMQVGRSHTSVYFEYFGEQPPLPKCLGPGRRAGPQASRNGMDLRGWFPGGLSRQSRL